MTEKNALIFGVSGQDGALLARFLSDKAYRVHGTSRDAQMTSFDNLDRVAVRDRVQFHSAVTTDFRSVLQILSRVAPDEVYLLAGQSSVGLSFEQPMETLESISVGTLNLLEAIRFLGLKTRLYNAGSGDCFGQLDHPADEHTAFRPRSPYAVAKASAHWAVANYREAYGLHACTGILFNHESPLRPTRFVTRKVVSAACRIAAGSGERLRLGNLDIERDWGWAPEYVQAMWLMLQRDRADDYVIASGRAHSLRQFVQFVFEALALDWQSHVDIDDALRRPTDIAHSVGSPVKAERELGWRANTDLRGVIAHMIAAEQGRPWPMGAD
ncbi:GDP-mannose 4,6-dehydratase [Arenimonas sp.]|uniref:GDP-mannose 4,6-dehydratase n=1 Tax=Arenimonas sp. TaxID=1872635 RepID=UPI0039E39B25